MELLTKEQSIVLLLQDVSEVEDLLWKLEVRLDVFFLASSIFRIILFKVDSDAGLHLVIEIGTGAAPSIVFMELGAVKPEQHCKLQFSIWELFETGVILKPSILKSGILFEHMFYC